MLSEGKYPGPMQVGLQKTNDAQVDNYRSRESLVPQYVYYEGPM